jgi:hypothetical protein
MVLGEARVDQKAGAMRRPFFSLQAPKDSAPSGSTRKPAPRKNAPPGYDGVVPRIAKCFEEFC